MGLPADAGGYPRFGVVCYFLDIFEAVIAREVLRECGRLHHPVQLSVVLTHRDDLGADGRVGVAEFARPRRTPEGAGAMAGGNATGKPFDMMFPLRGKELEFRPFLTRVAPVRDDKSQVVRRFGTNTGITQQWRLEDELRQNAERLSEADRCKDEFLAMLAHEFHNPLAPITPCESCGSTRATGRSYNRHRQ